VKTLSPQQNYKFGEHMKKILLFLLMAIITIVPMGAAQAIAPSETDAPSLIGGIGTVILDNKNSTTWARITDGKYGVLTYDPDPSISFDFTFAATGLEPGVHYSLIYYANPHPGNNPGSRLWFGFADGSGTIPLFSASANLGMNLPTAPDTNQVIDHNTTPDFYLPPFNYGAKIWLVPTECYDVGSKSIIVWSPDRFLFETGLINHVDTDKVGGGTISLITTIIEPSITFAVTAGDPEGTINFGSVMIGADSGERDILIQNTGTLTIKITTLVSAGFYTDCLFLQTPSLAYVKANVWQYTPLAPGASLTIKAKVHPTAAYSAIPITGNITFLAQLP
jgi:hypothetical protein